MHDVSFIPGILSRNTISQVEMFQEYTIKDDPISYIADYVYLSGWTDSLNIYKLRKRKIKSVICINMRDKSSLTLELYKKYGIEHYHFRKEDMENEDLEPDITEAVYMINYHVNRKERILVHCGSGISRAPTFVLAYFIDKYKLTSLKKALADLSSRRPCIDPNTGFKTYLESLCASHRLEKSSPS